MQLVFFFFFLFYIFASPFICDVIFQLKRRGTGVPLDTSARLCFNLLFGVLFPFDCLQFSADWTYWRSPFLGTFGFTALISCFLQLATDSGVGFC